MQSNQDNRDSWQVSHSDALGALYLASNTMATSMAVFIRQGFGKEALAWNSVFAFLLLLILAGHQGPAFSLLLFAFIAAQIWRRIETFRNAAKGIVVHSQFQGFPYLAMKMPFVKDEDFARNVIEPTMCFVTGMVLLPVSAGLGGYVMACGVAFIVRRGIESLVLRQRLQRMQDAKIEHEWYAEQLRR